MRNRIPRILTYLVAVLSTLPVFARDFQYTYEGQTLTYTVISEEDGTCQTKDGNRWINTSGNDVSGYLIIPATVNDGNKDFQVTSIGSYAFNGCYSLTSVTIPSSVTSIGDNAFMDCYSLTKAEFASIESLCKINFVNEGSNPLCYAQNFYINGEEITDIVIPDSITSIGSWAFFECSGLTKAEFSSIESLCKINFGNEYSNPLSVAHHLYINGEEITDIVIPDSVTSIGSCAFSGCSGLTTVIIPNSVTSIGNSAFSGCTSLTSMNIPNSVTSIDIGAFFECSGLTSVNIPTSVTSIEASTFARCTGLTSVNIPNSVTSIGNSAFSGCTSLTSMNIPNSVTSIGDYAFYGCRGLTTVIIPNSVTSIGSWAFEGCSGLTKAEFSSIESLLKIYFGDLYSNPMYYTHNLYINGEEIMDLVIPDDVFSIGRCAFAGCSGLTSVTIPNSVTSIDIGAFFECSGLTSVNIPTSVTSIEASTFEGCSGLTTVNIPNSVTSIGNRAFSGCTSLTSMNIPNSVTSIGSWAFEGCSGLTTVNIPNSVTSIDNGAFWGCSGLTTVNIPNSVTSIGSWAFDGCSGLSSVIIPNSVTSIDNWGAFNGCNGLIKSAYPNSLTNPFSTGIAVGYNPEGAIIEDGWIYGPEKSEIRFAPYYLEGDYQIPETVSSIGGYAFRGCNGLISVTIPNSVTSISKAAFAECSALTSVTIPNSVTSIDQWAFDSCTSLKSVTIPNSVTSIGYEAFWGCSGLTSVIIPGSVTSIGNSAFDDCSGLIKSAYPNSLTNPFPTGLVIGYNPEGAIIEDVLIYGSEKSEILFAPCYIEGYFQIPETVSSIGDEAFWGCSGLTSVVIPNSVTSIGYEAFRGCYGLTSVIIPSSVTSIDNSAFDDCSGLIKSAYPNSLTNPFSTGIAVDYNPERAIIEDGWIYGPEKSEIRFAPYYLEGDYEIPETVSSIGGYAFRGCNGLTSVTIPESVESIGSRAFYECQGLTKAEFGSIESLCEINFGDDFANPLYYSGNLYINGDEIKDLVIPESISSIGNYAFCGFKTLTTLSLGSSLSTIGESAFKNCSALKTIYSYNITPPALDNSAFSGVSNDAVVYVPKGRILAYSNRWKKFWDYREMGADVISLDKTTISMLIGEQTTITPTIQSDKIPEIDQESWTTSDPSVATVDNGIVTAVGKGNATIRFAITDKNGVYYTATCEVSVSLLSDINEIINEDGVEPEIYTLEGNRVYSDGILTLGIYIVRKGNKTSKIIVK